MGLNGGQQDIKDTFNFNFTGQPTTETIGLQMYLTAFAQCGAANGYQCAVSANFIDTAYIKSAVVTDAFGNIVSGAQIIGASGVNYQTINPVPEPSTYLLLLIGSVAGAGLLWRRKAARKYLATVSCV